MVVAPQAHGSTGHRVEEAGGAGHTIVARLWTGVGGARIALAGEVSDGVGTRRSRRTVVRCQCALIHICTIHSISRITRDAIAHKRTGDVGAGGQRRVAVVRLLDTAIARGAFGIDGAGKAVVGKSRGLDRAGPEETEAAKQPAKSVRNVSA